MNDISISVDSDSDSGNPPIFFQRNEPPQLTQHFLGIQLLNDKFFKNLYSFHQKSGFLPILISQICYLLTILFSLIFSTFITMCVDWKSIHDGTKKDLVSAIFPNCLPTNGRNTFLIFITIVFLIWWVVLVIQSVFLVNDMFRINQIWEQYLGPLNFSAKWETVVEKVKSKLDLPYVDVYHVVNRVMRWDNYMIAMIVKDTLGVENCFTKVLEWNLKRCIKTALFCENSMLIKDVLNRYNQEEYTKRLKKSFILAGIYTMILSPFVFSALSVYFVYRYVSEFHKNPKALGLFSFTPLAKWKLRDFNELEHNYILRLNKSHPKIIYFLSQFKSEILNIILKFLSFVFGSLLTILITVSLFNSDIIISLFLIEQPVIFYIGVLGGIFVLLHGTIPDETQVFEPEIAFNELLQVLHYMPVKWGSLNLYERHSKVKKLFRYRWINLMIEIFSVFYTPFLLAFYFPKKAENIVIFFRENSVEMRNLGIICSSALFEHGSHLIGNDTDIAIKEKMSHSIMNFQQRFPGSLTAPKVKVERIIEKIETETEIEIEIDTEINIEMQNEENEEIKNNSLLLESNYFNKKSDYSDDDNFDNLLNDIKKTHCNSDTSSDNTIKFSNFT